MTEKTARRCTRCYGTGSESYTETETDYVMGLALGAALGMGMFPSTKQVTKTRTCTRCRGTGKIED